MKRKSILLFLILALLLTACGSQKPPLSDGNGPGRMVRKIEVSAQPEDPSLARTYVTQQNMNELLAILRALENPEVPEQEPEMEGQSFYTVTATFANGQQSVYYLLGHTYLRLGDNPWCVITPEQADRFTGFLQTHPTDDGSVPPETTTPETTPETTPPTETTPAE